MMQNRLAGRFFLRPAAASFLAVAACFAAVLVLLSPRYWGPDDIGMVASLSGYLGGKPIPILIYGNVLLGFLLTPLYGLYPRVNWLIWLYIGLHAGSAWALVYLVLRHTWAARLKIFSVLVILLSEIYFVGNLTFATTATVAAISGFCLLLTAAQTRRPWKQKEFVLGALLTWIGSLIRPEATALVFVILIPLLVICRGLFPLKHLVVVLGSTGVLALACYAFNLGYLHQHPDLYIFYVYTRLVQQLQDTPRLVNATSALGAIHWTTNDLNLFARWFFPDPHVYSIQKLRYLVDHVSDVRPTFWSRLPDVPLQLVRVPFLPYSLLLLAIWLVPGLRSSVPPRGRIASLSMFLAAVGLSVYLLWKNRMVENVFLPALDACVIFSVFLSRWFGRDAGEVDTGGEVRPAHSGKRPSRFADLASGLVLMIVIGVVAQQAISASQRRVENEADYHRVISDIARLGLDAGGQKALIISPAFGIPWNWSNPLWVDLPPVQYLTMADYTFSPGYFAVLQKHQVISLPAGLYENRNVYLMTDARTMNCILKYVQYHQGIDLRSQVLYVPNYANATIFSEARLYKLEKMP